jgi:hypothetical protein
MVASGGGASKSFAVDVVGEAPFFTHSIRLALPYSFPIGLGDYVFVGPMLASA